MEQSEQLREIGVSILAEYDKAISACEAGDKQSSVTVLVSLMEGLDFQDKQIAGGLLTLYDYCITAIQSERFDEAHAILCQLRDSWREGINALQGHAQQG
jgi:flagellin-specific chaperone FliS